MGIFDKLIKTKPKKEWKALVSKPKNQMQESDSDSRESLFKWYKSIYESVPMINSIINVHTDNIVQEFYFEGSNNEKLKTWADEVNLMQFFYRISKSMLMYGNGYCEVVKQGESISKLKILDAIYLDVYRDPFGKIIGYSQIIGKKKLVLWGTTGHKQRDMGFAKKISKIESIVHFKLNVVGSEKYGRSIIESLRSSVISKIGMESQIGKILQKYVAPLIWAKVGSDEMPAQSAVVDSVAASLRDLESESEIATSHLVDLNVLGFDNKGVDISTPIKHIDQQIITGGQVPPILLGLMDSKGDKSAEIQLRNFGRRIKSIQREIKIEFEDNIIVGQGLGIPEDKLIWTKSEEREWEIQTDILRGLVTDGILTPQKANDLLPPEFQEELPEMPDPLNQQAVDDNGQQIPRPSQSKNDKVKDNPNDPTQTTKNKNAKGRVKKSERELPK